MAALTSSAVTLHRAAYVGLQRNLQLKDLTLVLTGQGTLTNPIPASALGFTKLLGPTVLINSDNDEIIQAVPDFDGDNLLLLAVTAEEDNGDIIVTTAPADVTGTFRGLVQGI